MDCILSFLHLRPALKAHRYLPHCSWLWHIEGTKPVIETNELLGCWASKGGFFKTICTVKGSMAIATPMGHGLSWPPTNRHRTWEWLTIYFHYGGFDLFLFAMLYVNFSMDGVLIDNSDGATFLVTSLQI